MIIISAAAAKLEHSKFYSRINNNLAKCECHLAKFNDVKISCTYSQN